jgi:hypothetical protein
MKYHYSLFFALVVALLSAPISAISAEQGKEIPQSSIECTTDKSNVPTCKKQSSSSESTNQTRMRKQCVFTCRKSHGIWVCRGNGPQCNGKSPWD